jgi:hypothetical protein
MKNFVTYSIWVFISSALLKSGLDMILDTRLGYLPVITLTIFVHVTIVFPVIMALNAVFIKNENR